MTGAGATPVAITGRAALALAERSLALRPLLIVSDFDGTLSPIVSDPMGARMLPLARRALRRLAGEPRIHVAILSGRTALDVAGRVRVGNARYLGNHGLERGRLGRRQPIGSLRIDAAVDLEGHTEEAERIAQGVADRIDADWLFVEPKLPAVAFHYRNAPDVGEAGQAVAAAVDALDPGRRFVRYPGRRVLELRPPGATAKGEAMTELLREVRPVAAFMLGDDRSDAEAFLVLRAARERGELDGLALAVQAHAEAPREVAEAADVLLASPAEAARFLSGLARRATR